MSKGKCPSVLSHKMEAIVYIFFAKSADFKIEEYYSDLAYVID